MFAKVDVRDIVKDHLRTLVTVKDERPDWGDYALFFGVPVLLASLLLWLDVCLTHGATGLLINGLAIFAGLLLNLLVLVHGLIRRYRDQTTHKDARRLLRELYANLAYGVLVCILGLIPLIAFGFGLNKRGEAIASWVTFFLTSNFLLTLLMILKRVHVLLNHEFKYPAKS